MRLKSKKALKSKGKFKGGMKKSSKNWKPKGWQVLQ
jgi:hypothetical protein